MPERTFTKAQRSLSALLEEVRLSGRTWCYADFSGSAGAAVASGNAVFVHAVIHGQVRLACSGGMLAELEAGDVALVLSGEAHALRTATGARALPFDALRREEDVDIPSSHAFGDGSRTTARVLSGRLQAKWPGEVSRGALPALLRAPADLLGTNAVPFAGMGVGSSALLTRLAEALLIAALRGDPACRRLLSVDKHDPVEEALQLIAASPAQPWTVESLARAVGMGRSNFAAHFSHRVGKAPMEVVAEHRMRNAAMLLRQGRMKIAEIADLAGYGSEAAFSRRFSRYFGMSPSQMRDEARAERKQAASIRPERLRGLLAHERRKAPAEPLTEPSPLLPAEKAVPSRSLFIAKGRRD